MILTLVAAITRFAFLYNPRAIVFDEVYFREYALHYKAGTYYFDLHPPLGKLLLGAWAAIAGVDADAMGKDPAVVMRVLPAFAGTLLIVVIYLLIRKLSKSRKIATLAAALVLLDTAILVESRLIVMDSMLLLFGITAVYAALKAREYTGRSQWLWFAFALFCAGCATSIKLTGLTALGMIGLLWLVDVINEKRWQNWKPAVGQAVLIGLIPLTVYMLTFAIHFALLPKKGPGDLFMSQQFQSVLKGDPLYKEDAKMGFIAKFKDLNKSIHVYEVQLNTGTHPYASKWYTWPIAKRGVYTYTAPADDGKSRYIYANANPAIWWGTLLGALVVVIGWIFKRQRFSRQKWPLIFLGVGWMANFLPFSLIVRPMFLYHYFFALIFSIGFVVVGLGALAGWNDEDNDKDRPFAFPSRWSALLYWGILGAGLAAFLYFSPITYGTPLTPQGLESRMWLSSWR
ncbi:MAG: phospholipid carrier-dependent glycosyltransferase [Solirubrobacteraceae bacterium]|nr:phospholipid carrier-dependent glycosyltransferase [Solirubrobacteraceae bacterium]